MKIFMLSSEGFYTGMAFEYAGNIPPENATNIEPPAYVDGFIRKFTPPDVWEQILSSSLPVPAVDLATAKIAYLDLLKEAFHKAEQEGVLLVQYGATATESMWIDANRNAVQNITNLKQFNSVPRSRVQFRDFFNVTHDIPAEGLDKIYDAVIEFGLTLYAKKWNIEGLIAAATTVDGLYAIDLTLYAVPPSDTVE